MEGSPYEIDIAGSKFNASIVHVGGANCALSKDAPNRCRPLHNRSTTRVVLLTLSIQQYNDINDTDPNRLHDGESLKLKSLLLQILSWQVLLKPFNTTCAHREPIERQRILDVDGVCSTDLRSTNGAHACQRKMAQLTFQQVFIGILCMSLRFLLWCTTYVRSHGSLCCHDKRATNAY